MKTKIIAINKKILAPLLVLFFFLLPLSAVNAGKFCGNGLRETAIDFGCQGKGNAIIDMFKGITRFLSAGVGIVVSLMIIIAGIQYITSAGNPQALAAAKNRLLNAVIALLIFIFLFAVIQYLIPTDF